MEMKIEEFDVGPNVYGYFFLDYNLDFAALALSPDAPEPAKQAAIVQGHGHASKRPPKDNWQFILDDRNVEDLDPNAILTIRSCIEELQPFWVEEVKDACRIANHPRVIADWCELSLAAVVAIIDNLKARGEIPQSVGHSDVA